MLLEEQVVPVDVSYLSMDSRKRNMQLFPDASRYVVDFDRVFKDVVSVELVYALYGKFGDEDYVNLYIDELVPNMVSNCTQIGGSFTQLPLLLPKNEYTRDKFRSIKVFPTPLNKLAKFSVRFMGFDGIAYPIREHMLRFEITCLKFHLKKNVVLTREAISVWVPPDSGLTDATNDIADLEMQTRVQVPVQEPSESSCRRTLGIPPKPFVLFEVQQVANAFKARSATLRQSGNPAGTYLPELKCAFKVLARKIAVK